MEPFDIRGPLPTGTTLLEASAGTGKTWTIGALVTRYIAEGVATLDQLLVVTFGRAASQELRQRVRDQLVATERALTDPATADPDDEVVALLLADADRVPERRLRLRQALSDFDAATIATTHQFCQLVLRSLGVAGDTDSGAELVEDLDELLGEVVDDLYLRGFIGQQEQPEFTHAQAHQIAMEAGVKNPSAVLEPVDPPPGVAARRVGFAQRVREELDRRKRRLGILSYDDLLSQLADALTNADAPARARMRQRWQIVLVDEFQDTDPVQWQVLDRAFTGHATMVLIGDPKQAIYNFRGGDVVSYLQAARTADSRMTLGTNWRTDADVLAALQVVLEGAELGDPEIVGQPVSAAHSERRLTGAPYQDPFRLRVVTRSELGVSSAKEALMPKVRAHIGTDVARDISALLASGAMFTPSANSRPRPIRPGDIAVLASAGARLREVKAALHEVGIPAVIAGGGSVFTTPGASHWLTLLEALEQPHRSDRVRAAAMTPFIGHSATELDDGGEDLTDAVARQLREWSELVTGRGVAAVLEVATAGGLPARVLGGVDGERSLTDLRHVGQELHEAALATGWGLPALLTWLREQLDAGDSTTARTRRLDSDAAAVQLSTIHGSKGLQWPVVYLPFLSDHWVRKEPVALFHGPEPHQHRSIDVGGSDGPGWAANVARSKSEAAGEQLRLLYVALTRAQTQVITWWAPGSNAPDSALHRLLLGRRPGESAIPDRAAVPRDEDAIALLREWAERGGPSLEPSVLPSPVTPELPAVTAELRARRFDRAIDVHWRRTSYTALSRVIEPAGGSVGSEPESIPKADEVMADDVVADEPAGPEPAADDALLPDPALAVPSPMAALPVGARFGSLVHAVLETTDPAAEDLRAALVEQIRTHQVRWPVELDLDELAAALLQVLHSPLGRLADDRRLVDIPLTDRLAEMDFELPLAGGDDRGYPATDVTLGDLAPLLRTFLQPDDPLLPYADLLEAQQRLAEQPLRGYLTGSVDVVLRVGGRYLVADYKTNWLGPADADLSAYHYRPAAMAAAMGHSDYPLQALLYAVVLHRFLRWRLPGYDPERHLGGVLYLYLRGMCGPDTPVVDGVPCGVFTWTPPLGLVTALSDLLDGAQRTEGRAS